MRGGSRWLLGNVARHGPGLLRGEGAGRAERQSLLGDAPAASAGAVLDTPAHLAGRHDLEAEAGQLAVVIEYAAGIRRDSINEALGEFCNRHLGSGTPETK